MPGGFGVKPPQWFHDRPTKDVASELSVEPDKVDKITSVVSLKTVPKVDGDLAIDHKTHQTQELNNTKLRQVSPGLTNPVTVPVKFARIFRKNTLN